MVQYVGVDDLIRRWVYTPQGARKIIRTRGFPEPEIVANRGKTKLWFLPDIVVYERAHPELTSNTAKLDKIYGYAIANLKKSRRRGSGAATS